LKWPKVFEVVTTGYALKVTIDCRQLTVVVHLLLIDSQSIIVFIESLNLLLSRVECHSKVYSSAVVTGNKIIVDHIVYTTFRIGVCKSASSQISQGFAKRGSPRAPNLVMTIL